MFGFFSRFPSWRRLPSGCFPVLPAAALLHSHKKILSGLAADLSVPDRIWQNCYLPLFSNAAAWAQQLTAGDRALFSARLARAVSEIAAAAGKPLPFADGTASRGKHVPVWHYAVVTTALCRGMGADVLSLRVRMFERDGKHRGEWNYFAGTMPPGLYYRFKVSSVPIEVAPGMDLWLARSWLPTAGLSWLTSSPPVMRWLLKGLYSPEVKADGLMKETAESVAPSVSRRREGRVFMDWLQDGLDKGRITVNSEQGYVFLMEQGILLSSPKIFILYNSVEWRKVQRAFQRLDLHIRRPDGGDIWSCRLTGSGLKVNGLLLPTARLKGTSRYGLCPGLVCCEAVI